MRLRKLDSLAFSSQWETNFSGYWFGEASGYAELRNTSTTIDAQHPGYFNNLSGDSGGTFDLWSTTHQCTPAVFNHRESGGSHKLIGSCVPNGMQAGYTPVDEKYSSLNEFQLLATGATMISRALPTNPSFGLSRAIGEIKKDGMPSMVFMQTLKERSRYLKNSGNEYLNVQFGWLPLVSDLKNFAKSVKNSGKTLRQYEKASDTKIRRRHSYPKQTSSGLYKTGVNGAGGLFLLPQLSQNMSAGTLYRASEHQTWFSGAFRYHIPTGDDLPSKFLRWESEANKLLGLRLTPKLVWDLAPWSWAVDWFTNVGDVINNISRLGPDGLVLQYGYIMDELIDVDDESALATGGNGYGNEVVPQWCAKRTVTKKLSRRGANPYGFGVANSALTLQQEAVVVALGLSHGFR